MDPGPWGVQSILGDSSRPGIRRNEGGYVEVEVFGVGFGKPWPNPFSHSAVVKIFPPMRTWRRRIRLPAHERTPLAECLRLRGGSEPPPERLPDPETDEARGVEPRACAPSSIAGAGFEPTTSGS